jgi:uracil DNA glycosylase
MFKTYFDGLAKQGVLFINAAWTYTSDQDLEAHLAAWEPILFHLLRELVVVAQEPLVFLLLGKKAQATFTASGVAELENRVVRIDLPHPRHATFLRQNPWLLVNERLGNPPIIWWPPFPRVDR